MLWPVGWLGAIWVERMEDVRSLSLDQKASYVEALKQEEASLFLTDKQKEGWWPREVLVELPLKPRVWGAGSCFCMATVRIVVFILSAVGILWAASARSGHEMHLKELTQAAIWRIVSVCTWWGGQERRARVAAESSYRRLIWSRWWPGWGWWLWDREMSKDSRDILEMGSTIYGDWWSEMTPKF